MARLLQLLGILIDFIVCIGAVCWDVRNAREEAALHTRGKKAPIPASLRSHWIEPRSSCAAKPGRE